MGLEDVLAKLRSEKSVKAAYALDETIYEKMVAEESSVIVSAMGTRLKNKALEAVLTKKNAVCVFCEYTFETPDDHMMIMEDSCGNLIGHDVPKCMMDKYRKDDPEIVWLCDDFALYPYRTQSSEIIVVMLPCKIKVIGPSEGAKDPIALFPATTTDTLLRQHFKFPLNETQIATAIIAFDPM